MTPELKYQLVSLLVFGVPAVMAFCWLALLWMVSVRVVRDWNTPTPAQINETETRA